VVVRWSKKALSELQKAYDYIKMDSPPNAIKVINEIVRHTEALADTPEIYPPDNYRVNNKGQYRAFVLYHYRVSYKIMKDTILIVRLRHTSMSPLSY